MDVGFPIIRYAANEDPCEWGRAHGEQFRNAIAELVEIRTELMREKNPSLTLGTIDRLAHEQWEKTRAYDARLFAELEGLVAGSNLTPQQLVILNNYTDFRDIQMEEQGCSIVYVGDADAPIAGQTWDMHGSAKNYVCCLEVEADPPQYVFSLVGCLGMMGYSASGLMIGVNNINTAGAVPGTLWPAIVRKTLRCPTREAMVSELTSAPVTSGHNYLVADARRGEMWEVLPGLSERVLDSEASEDGKIFHTNHCLGVQTRRREQSLAQNSTSHIRYELLAKKIDQVRSLQEVYELLNDHENYPKSICSNYQSDSQDPSITCGGAVGDLRSGEVRMWRGDPEYDAHFVRHDFWLQGVGS